MKVMIYLDVDGRWRWRVRSSNGKTVACSGESFHDRYNAKRGAQAFVRSILSANYKNTLVYVVEE